MDEVTLRQLVDDVRAGVVEPDAAVEMLRRLPFVDVGGATVDHHRHLRQGMPETIYGPGKTPDDCAVIVRELLTNGTGPVLLTRSTQEQREACRAVDDRFVELGGCLLWREPCDRLPGRVAVVTAGTSDRAVADEAIATLRASGVDNELVTDVGVAGLHRLLARLDTINSADVVVVIAGMEGALSSVIGGLTAAPVIAVPTSVGYGSALEGVTALLAMHASCASGVTVVGIDNGFGAASAAARIIRRRSP